MKRAGASKNVATSREIANFQIQRVLKAFQSLARGLGLQPSAQALDVCGSKSVQ